ncbi:protein FAR1-RELATED SEQUENCE 4-like [Medicago truncatula]|uniref:protein FAR1-RELATED SEQUENCE 4-like n=1 Tax=Medicago truncatula TaxID=3880 RepID=UPI0019675BBE|nr:protein FAR1-RELATED SEQUENCE 4-like [Medicago truncatula]
MTKSLAKPRNILTDLKERNKESVTLIKQVYNARTRWCKGQREDKTELQYLITRLEENQSVYFTRANSEETTLEDLFFAHPKSIDMLNTFPTVLVMDSTYKTNTYRMPLFQIVGVTSTKLTYSIALAFLSFERENNFIWTLAMFVGLLTSKNNMPKVIVTDRDLALMKVVAKVLPKTDHVFCYFHIRKNVKGAFLLWE